MWGVPAGQIIPTWLPFPDSEDHENLQRKGVTHILSVHNGAKPVLEVRAWLGDLGTTRGSGSWEGTPGSFSWPGQEQCWIDTHLHQLTPICTNLHRFVPFYTRQCCPKDLSDGFGEGTEGCLGHPSGVFGLRGQARCCRGVPTRGRRRPANGAPAGRGHRGRDPLPARALLPVPGSLRDPRWGN